MTCTINTVKPMMHSEALELAGCPKSAWISKKRKEDFLLPAIGMFFMCGDIEICTHCGGMAEFLCDEPMGKNKTCDAHLCYECTASIGSDLDLCKVHALRHIT